MSNDPITRHHELRSSIDRIRASEAVLGYTVYDRQDRFDVEHGQCGRVVLQSSYPWRRYRCEEHRASLVTDGYREMDRP